MSRLDKKRFDWMQSHDAAVSIPCDRKVYVVRPWSGGRFEGRTLRQAVDKARKAVK